ncbi:MAG: hypothetical protein E8D49_08815 [Nitrospira sp.]|nr:MAG: hypothetical protein E8D49_08815 [Nitrospira sp.]
MRYLRRVGFVSCLLIVGVLGGLLAPYSSEAAPATLTIQGLPVGLTLNGPGCGNDTGFNTCYSLNGTNITTDTTRQNTIRIGNWYVGDVSTSNQARVLINDVSTTGSVDTMKMTGVTFTPVIPGTVATPQVVHAVVTNTYNVGGGNIAGDYTWGMVQGGQFDPPTIENVVGDRLKLTGTGTANGVNFPLGVLDTGSFTTSTVNNIVGYVARSKAASVVKPACNTGSGRCAPVIKYDYEITVRGLDTLFLTDSIFGAGGPCYKGLKLALLKLVDHIFDQFDHLADAEHPMGCTKFVENINAPEGPLQGAVNAIITEGQNTPGAVAAETCLGACIVINKTVDPDLNTGEGPVTFGFTGTGDGIDNFTLITDGEGGESTTFSNLTASLVQRTITETGFPYVPDTFDGVPPEQSDHDSFWWTHTVSCESANNPAPGNTSGPTTWTTFAPTFSDVHANRSALGNDNPLPEDLPIPEIAISRQGYVTVTNLAAGDTLTCTFDNRLYNDDHPNNNPDIIIID